MTTGERADGGGNDVDPWAPGGTMAPVPHTASGTLHLTFESDETSRPPRRTPNRRRWFAAGGVALLAAIGLVVAFGGDGSTPSPPEPGEAVDVDVEPFPGVPEPTAPRATPPPLLADRSAPADEVLSPTDRLVLAAAPREFVVDIAPELAGINRTEVIALQGDEGLYEVSLPSGRVRVTDVGFFTGQTELVATDQFAVIWPTPEGTAQIVSTQRSMGIPGLPVAQVSWSPGTDRMYLWAGQAFPNSDEPSVLAIDGNASEFRLSPAAWVDDVEDPAELLDFDGGLLRTDTGGTFNIGPGGAKRITTGAVIANGANHLLLRECDEQRACNLVSVGRDGERQDWPIDLPDGVAQQQLAGLSAGGDALLVIGDRFSADVPGTRRSSS